MRSTLLLFTALLVGAAALAQPRPAPRRPQRVRDASVTAVATDAGVVGLVEGGADAGRARSAPTCCCRAWSHGWQYAWRTEAECSAQSGSCVSPDHC